MTARRYVLAAGVRVHVLDDEAIVFNPFSWETHLLNPAAALVLELAAAAPCTETAVSEVLAEVLDPGHRRQAAEHAKRLLGELLDLRLLVEPPAPADARC